jgi:hypothetical protein
MARAFVALIVALLVITGCGSVRTQGSSNTLPQPSPPTAALAKWKDFPAKANPRPLIVFQTTFERVGPSGFVTEPARKVAWGCNKFLFATGVKVSADPPSTVSAGGVSYPGISSARAYSELMTARAPAEVPPGCAGYRPFVIKAIRLGSAGFSTDRGTSTMSAWLFDIEEIDAEIGYLAIDPSVFWGGGLAAEGRGARVSADGRTIKIGVSNAQPGPCGADYTAASAESAHAVAIAVKRIPHPAPSGEVVCDLMLRTSFIEVKLNAPLDGRVLLDENGAVGMACREEADC